jgi:hypothetical protein
MPVPINRGMTGYNNMEPKASHVADDTQDGEGA